MKASSATSGPAMGGGGSPSAIRPAGSSRAARVAAAVMFLCMVATGIFLGRLGDIQRLGAPGVEVARQDVYDENGKVAATNAIRLPLTLPRYASTNLPISQVELNWLPRDTTYGRMLYQASNGMQILMSGVLMGTDRTSIHKPEYCLVGQGLKIDRQEVASIRIEEPVPYDLPVMKMICSREVKLADGTTTKQGALYVYWFVADGQLSADHNKRMMRMAWDLVTTGVLQRWAYISCFAYANPGEEEAVYAQITDLIRASVPKFQRATGEPIRLAREP